MELDEMTISKSNFKILFRIQNFKNLFDKEFVWIRLFFIPEKVLSDLRQYAEKSYANSENKGL